MGGIPGGVSVLKPVVVPPCGEPSWGSKRQRQFSAFVKGVGGKAGGDTIADTVRGFAGECFRERIESAIGRGHHERAGWQGFLLPCQEVADRHAVAVPSGQAVFGQKLRPQFGKPAAGRAIGGSAGDFFPNEGLWRDDRHVLALFGQGPGSAGAAPVGALVVNDDAVAKTGLASEDLFGRPDMAKLDAGEAVELGLPALEAGLVGKRAGGEDDGVGRVGCDFVGIKEGVEPESDTEFHELAFVPVKKIEDLGAAGLHPGEAELAADDGQSLNDFNVVAAFSSSAGGFQSGRAAAYN